MNLENLLKIISENYIFLSMLILMFKDIFVIVFNTIIRNILLVVFVKVYKIPFEKAVDSSIRMTTFSKGK